MSRIFLDRVSWSAGRYLVLTLGTIFTIAGFAKAEGPRPTVETNRNGSKARPNTSVFRANRPLGDGTDRGRGERPTDSPAGKTTRESEAPTSPAEDRVDGSVQATVSPDSIVPKDAIRTVQHLALFGLVSLAPVAVLMVTAFVRINVVLILLRQALGSPQVPGNQVLSALALLLTALVMRPAGERIYHDAILPYSEGKATLTEAWSTGSAPIKLFMVEQIVLRSHQDYLWTLQRHATTGKTVVAEPVYPADFPLRVVAPAFLLSELTTSMIMGFYIYLPFLVIDLVVSATLAAMGLFMLPPTLVAMPVKLIVFVLADGWMLVASMLLSSFAAGGP